MECDFKTQYKYNTIVTQFHNIDVVGSPIGITFKYSDKDGLKKMIEDGRCYQTIEQFCQPWIQLLYDMDDTIIQDPSRIHQCTCLRYSITLHTHAFSTADR